MNYIIFDLEWNQPYNNEFSYLRRTNMEFTGEIIQIGAVKVDARMEIVDTFNAIVQPYYLKNLHKHVLSLTGISKEEILNGEKFDVAIKRFFEWCGPCPSILSWGFDDLLVLIENLRVHHLQKKYKFSWFDAQKIYGYIKRGTIKQISLANALELEKLPQDLPQHYALNDALYTARVLDNINLEEALANTEIREAIDLSTMILPQPIKFTIHGLFKEKKTLFKSKSVILTKCPYCKHMLERTSIEKTTGNKYMSLGTCPIHGQFSIFWKVHKVGGHGANHNIFVTKSVGNTNKELNEWYFKKLDKNRIKYEEYQEKMRLHKIQNKE